MLLSNAGLTEAAPAQSCTVLHCAAVQYAHHDVGVGGQLRHRAYLPQAALPLQLGAEASAGALDCKGLSAHAVAHTEHLHGGQGQGRRSEQHRVTGIVASWRRGLLIAMGGGANSNRYVTDVLPEDRWRTSLRWVLPTSCQGLSKCWWYWKRLGSMADSVRCISLTTSTCTCGRAGGWVLGHWVGEAAPGPPAVQAEWVCRQQGAGARHPDCSPALLRVSAAGQSGADTAAAAS